MRHPKHLDMPPLRRSAPRAHRVARACRATAVRPVPDHARRKSAGGARRAASPATRRAGWFRSCLPLGEPGRVTGKAVSKAVQLDCDRVRPSAPRRRPALEGDTWVQDLQGCFPEVRMSLDELAEWHTALDRLADETAHETMGVSKRNSSRHEPFGQVDGGERRPTHPK